MPKLLRSALLVLLMVSLAAPAYAQEDTEAGPIVIQGTLELENLVIALRDAYVEANPDADIMVDPGTGLSGGFTALCSGATDIVMSTEPISDARIAECANNEQAFIETVLVYEAVTLVADSAAALTCLPDFQLEDLWQLGAPTDSTWVGLGSTLETPIVLYGPSDADAAYRLFSTLVPAGALREDITTLDTAADILSAVQEPASSAMGFMSLADFIQANTDDAVTPLQVQDTEGNCVTPSSATLEDGTYPLARTGYLYVNAASAEEPEVQSFMDFVLSNEAGIQALGAEQGYTLAETGTYARGLDNVMTLNTGRTFTRPASPVTLAADTTGTITVVGTSMLDDLTRPIRSAFSTAHLTATVEVNTLGNVDGWAAICAGEADVLQATRPATADELAICAENNIELQTIDLGYEALVLAVPASADWIECVDAELAANIFRAAQDDQPAAATWQDLNEEWPDSELLLIVPPFSTGETDYLIGNLISDLTFPFRIDGLEKPDAKYRVVGVGNTDNALTYLWWTDYNDVEANVKLLGVGDECVVPTAETIADETYPLAYPVSLYVSHASFDNALVRAFLWYLYDDASLDQYAAAGYLGLDIDQMGRGERDAIFDMLAQYEIDQAELEATQGAETGTSEATPAPDTSDGEATPETTDEVTPEASGDE